MPLGDIVQTTATWREQGYHAHTAYKLTPGIVVWESASGCVHHILFAGRENIDSWGCEGNDGPTVGNPEYLEVVHELQTAEARRIHEAYPQHQGHDYFWYCQQRGVTPFRTPGELAQLSELAPGPLQSEEFAEAPRPLPVAQWQRGDVLTLTESQHTHDYGHLCRSTLTIGTQVIFRSLDEAAVSRHCDVLVTELSGADCELEFSRDALRWTSRPVVTIAAAPAFVPPTTPGGWLRGDVLERIISSVQPGRANVAGVAIGEHRVFAQLHLAGLRLLDANGWEVDYTFSISKWRWVSRPGVSAAPETPAAEDLAAVPASAWRVGDTVRRIAATAETDYGVVGGDYIILPEPNGWGSSPNILTDAYEGNGWLIPAADLVLVHRASVPAGVLPSRTQIGARVLIHWPGDRLHGWAASICPVPTYGTMYRLYVDGFSSYRDFEPRHLRPLLEEPALPALALPTSRDLWLSVDGASLEELRAFERALVHRGLRPEIRISQGFGSAESGPLMNFNSGRRAGLVVGKNGYFYYYQDPSYAPGELLRDWNQVLARYPLAPVAAPPVKQHALVQLPHAFVVEQDAPREQTDAQANAQLATHGFRGFMGQYTLFLGNQALGTSLLGAAQAFQAKHRCPWLNSRTDTYSLATLFRNRLAMLTTSAAQQRFAVDVDASGPHLMIAFKAFMAAIGYRQENPDKTSGPYVLLNGGNLFVDQPATWQYSEAKNNRNALLNLAEPAESGFIRQMSGKSGWDKLGERLANRGVALPVLDCEDLDRSPVVGDKVCLVFNELRDDLPETELTLRSHSCGRQYTVSFLSGGLCQLEETGMRLHASRLQVLETPRGLQNGDQVVMEAPYGEHLRTGDILTLMNGILVDGRQTAYYVPPAHYAPLTDGRLTASLLQRYGLILPCVVQVLNPDFLAQVGHEVVLSTAWPLNNQELAFWTEDNPEKDSWLEREDFQVVTASAADQPVAWKLLKGSTRETTVLQIGETRLTLAQLEEALAA